MDFNEANIKNMAKAFVAGLVYWGIMVLLAIAGTQIGSTGSVLLLIALAMFFGTVILSIKGWDWLATSQRYTYGFKLQFMMIAVFILTCTLIGSIPVIYLTGRGTMLYAGMDI